MAAVTLVLVVDGPASRRGRVEAALLGETLAGLAELCSRAARIVYGERANATVLVRAEPRPGSFELFYDLVVTFWEPLKVLLKSDDVDAALKLAEIVGLAASPFTLIAWLKGRRAAKRSGSGSERGVSATRPGRVTGGHVDAVLELAEDPAIRRALERVVQSLVAEGIDELRFARAGLRRPARVETIRKTDLPAFSTDDLAEERPLPSPSEVEGADTVTSPTSGAGEPSASEMAPAGTSATVNPTTGSKVSWLDQ